MADPFIDKQFSPGTVIDSPWLNGINDSVLAANTYISTIGGLVPGTKLYNRINDTYDVRDYGAVGDWNGITGTDDAPAFRAALAAVPSGGTLYIPTGRYLLNSAVNNAILDFTPFPNKPITIRGDGWSLRNGGSFSFSGASIGPLGSILVIGSAINSLTDFWHQAPTDLIIGGVCFRDFAIVTASGAYGAPHGQNGFNIDGTANANGYIENLIMDSVFIDNFASGSSILVNGIGNVQGVLAGAHFRNSKFMNFFAPNFGDSNTIEKNTIGANAGVTGAVGINFYNVSGATNTRIIDNNMVNFNGMILCNGGTKTIIDGNEFEMSSGFPNTLGALISLAGANGIVDSATITNNSISQNSLLGNYTPLLVTNANNTRISGNRSSTLVNYPHYVISANSSYTLVEADNTAWINGIVQAAPPVQNLAAPSSKNMLRGQTWTSYTPTITAGTGAFGSVTATGAYQMSDTHTLKLRLDILINTVGTAAGSVQATLPTGLLASAAQSLAGREFAITGKGLSVSIANGGNLVVASDAAGNSIIGAGNHLVITGEIEV